MLKIAIIDNGINENIFRDCKIEHHRLYQDEDYSPTKDCIVQHGTQCAMIIKELSETNYITIDLCVFDKYGKTSINKLLEALEWCYTHKVDVINMSFGTIDFRDFWLVDKIIQKIHKANIIMVAAVTNLYVKGYPSCAQHVFGVRLDEFGELHDNQIGFVKDEKNPENGFVVDLNSNQYLKCNPVNSFAAPVLTSHIINYKSRHKNADFKKILHYLIKKSCVCDLQKPLPHCWTEIEFSRDIFCVFIEDRKSFDILIKFFKNDKYNIIPITDLNYKMNRDYISYDYYFDTGKSLENILGALERIYKGDIILLHLVQKSKRKHIWPCVDYIIKCNRKSLIIKDNKSKIICDTSTYRKIYTELLKILECEKDE